MGDNISTQNNQLEYYWSFGETEQNNNKIQEFITIHINYTKTE